MAKDILLYGPIWQYTAMYFFDQVNEAQENYPEVDLTLRVNTEGGSPEYCWSIIAKVQEMPSTKIKAESQVHSMGLFLLAYVPVENVECLDVTRGLLHRAAYPEYVESNPNYFTDALAANLAKTNKDLEKAFRARVNVEVLEALPQMKEKNITLKDIFSMDGRIEVILTAQDLKKIGLVKTINKITPSKKAEIEASLNKFKTCKSIDEFKIAAQSISTEQLPKEKNYMTLEEIKAQYPGAYASIVAIGREEGIKAGAKAEQDRVNAWLAWKDIDAEAVAKGIKDGAEFTMTVMSEMNVKAAASAKVAAVKVDNPGAIATPKPSDVILTTEQQQIAALVEDIDARLGIKKKAPVAVTA